MLSHSLLDAMKHTLLCSVLIYLVDSSGSRTPNPPHILFIVADDLGYHDVGYHGSEIKTPNLDKLAGEGVKLENYYVQPLCTPTRSQLLSGRYQIHTGLQHELIWNTQPNGLPLDHPIISEKLKETGYATHMVGKWHVGFYTKDYLPTSRGFDSYYGYYGGSEEYYTHNTCDGKFCGYDFRDNTTVDTADNNTYSTFLFNNRAIDIVSKHDPKQPLFLYLAFQAVHAPLEVPEQYEMPYSFIVDNNRRKYAGMATCMDEAIGNVTAAFQEYGLWNNTVMIFSTDNGGQIHKGGNNWPLRGWKASLWEGGMKGIGFLRSPFTPQRKINKELIHVSDWYPTLIEISSSSMNGTKPLDGFNQWPTLSKGIPSPRTEILHNIDIMYPKSGEPFHSGMFDTRTRAALRSGDWKIITGDPGNGSWIPPPHSNHQAKLDTSAGKQNIWLFNITADPNEELDLSHFYPDVVEKLLSRLTYYNSTSIPPRYPASDPNSNPKLHGGAWGPWK